MTTTKKTFKEFILDRLSNVDLTKQNKLFYYLDNYNLVANLLFIDKTFTKINRIYISEKAIQELVYEDQNSKYQLYGDITNLYSNLIEVFEEIRNTQVSIIRADLLD